MQESASAASWRAGQEARPPAARQANSENLWVAAEAQTERREAVEGLAEERVLAA
jgi:hypothetical protein